MVGCCVPRWQPHSNTHIAGNASSVDDALIARTTSFLKSVLKKSLGAHVFVVGKHAVQCQLAGDPLDVSVFLPMGQERNCHMKVLPLSLLGSPHGSSLPCSAVTQQYCGPLL